MAHLSINFKLELFVREVISNPQQGYRLLRGIQISMVFSFSIFVQELWRFPHAGWAGFTLMMIYAGFDNGTTLVRASHRFLGVLLGVFLGYILWIFGHIDYRLLYFIIPFTVSGVFFWAGTAYSIPTIFTVSTSILAFGYFDSQSSFVVSVFIMDYTACTVIGFVIILLFEHFWFRHYQMLHRFIRENQQDVIKNLYTLVHLLNQDKIRRTDWFRGCITLTASLFEMDRLVLNTQFAACSEHAVGDEFIQFVALSNQVFVNLKALYIACYTTRYRKYDYNQLVDIVHADLNKLNTLIVGEAKASSIDGVLHAADR